ncbi:DNA-directed RNA polymerase I subunit RPA43 [Echeneis naucrates]|uniref:DNA-directed RNA polymerase subunit n=1 Tax=Echeneis naucrates TaxID=173247 RepID=A0A665TRC7_ECHNA|nr:DNA-directed RNA polymerase I subunit RPA43 [Echeneis naucrates]
MANLEHAEVDSKHVNMPGEISAACAPVQPADVSSATGGSVGTVPCSIPSFAAASELLSAPYSCLVMNTHRRHIALPPLFLNKKRSGIREELEDELLKFSPRLKGVPLAYDGVRIVGPHGDIYDDNGYIHMDIEANFIVFQPKKGQKLLGKVNKLGTSYVGCLVHGCFNASIPKPNLVSMETWRDAGPRIGAEVEFEVTALDADVVGVLLIRGRLDRTKVQELMAMGESSELSIPTEQPDTEPKPEPTEQSPDETSKKKKKKKKKKDTEEEREEQIASEPNGTIVEANGNEAGEKKKKKKKKDKHTAEEDVELSPVEVHGSDSSGYISDKPSKKRKHDIDSDATPGLSEASEPPKSKKKKKSNTEQVA